MSSWKASVKPGKFFAAKPTPAAHSRLLEKMLTRLATICGEQRESLRFSRRAGSERPLPLQYPFQLRKPPPVEIFAGHRFKEQLDAGAVAASQGGRWDEASRA